MTNGLEAPVFTLHHVAMAVNDLDASTRAWEVLGFRVAADLPDAMEQDYGVCLRFLRSATSGLLLELVAPLRAGSVVSEFLAARGVGLYHSCFEVSALPIAVTRLRQSGYRPVGRPVPAVAFGGRRIQFMYSPAAGLVELLEAKRPAPCSACARP